MRGSIGRGEGEIDVGRANSPLTSGNWTIYPRDMWMQCCAWLVAGEWDGCGYFFFWRANNLCTTFHLLMVFSFFGTIPVLAGWAMQWGNQGCQVRWRVAIDPSNGWIMSQVNVDRWSCSLLVSRTIGDIFLLAWFEAPNNFCHITFLSIIFESLKEVTIVWWWIWMFAGQQAFWNECQSNYWPPPPRVLQIEVLGDA